MTTSTLPSPAGLALPAALLDALREGVVQLRPVYAEANPADLVDFAYVQLNPAAQRLLGLPAQPAGTRLAQAPGQRALLGYCRAAFGADTAGPPHAYQDARGGHWHVTAQRQGAHLVALFAEVPAATPYAVYDHTPAAICLLRGPQREFEYCNAAYQALFPGRSLLGRCVAEALPELVGQGFGALLDRVYQTGEAYTGTEVPVAAAATNGQPAPTRYFNFTYQAYHEQGQVVGVSVFAFEVSEQVQARRAREAQAAALQRLFEQAPVAIAILRGPQHVVELANAAACARWGQLPEQVLNRPLREVLPNALRDDDDLVPLLTQVLATGVPHVAHELPLLMTRHGRVEKVYWDRTCQPIRDPNGQLTGVTVVATDVSQQVATRRRVQELNEELHAFNEELSTSCYELACAQHELHLLNQELEARVAVGVAEAQQARAASERQRQRLERFFEQAPAAVCVLDGPDLVFELVNPALQRLLPGRPLQGLPLLVALPEVASHPVWQQLQQVYATGETHQEPHAQLSLMPHLGCPPVDFHLQCVQQARYDEHGRIDGVLVFALDMTAQVRVQQRAEALQAEVLAAVQRRAQEREALYQVFAQTPAAVALMHGPEFRYTYVNEAFSRMFPGRELRGQPMADVLPETVAHGFLALVARVYETGEAFSGTEVPLTITQPGGPLLERYFNFTYQAYRENGLITGVSVFAYDVSEQVRARQERDAGLAQMQTVFEHAPVALALLAGPTYVAEVANPVICAFWGRTRAQVLGRPIFEALPAEVTQGYHQLFEEVRRTGRPFVAQEWPLPLVRNGQRETAYSHFVCQPLTDAQGQVTAVVVVATDVSLRVLARQQLAQANAELRTTNAHLTRTNADLDNFIYTASHDLKAPITNVESLLLLLRKQLPPAARQAGLVPRVLDMMQGAIERFQLTIGQLTDLSRLQQAYAEPPEAVDLAAVVEAVRLDLAPELEATAARLVVDLTPCPSISFAPQHLRSVVYNLLSNALKYHHPGRPPLVHLRCHTAAGTTLLEVQDNGLGLSARQQAKLFGLFQRQHAHVAGSGVGLYMVKRIVENAGGTVTVQSQPGVGSTFTVALPAQPPAGPNGPL